MLMPSNCWNCNKNNIDINCYDSLILVTFEFVFSSKIELTEVLLRPKKSTQNGTDHHHCPLISFACECGTGIYSSITSWRKATTKQL